MAILLLNLVHDTWPHNLNESVNQAHTQKYRVQKKNDTLYTMVLCKCVRHAKLGGLFFVGGIYK
jgi:hypothetical protein